MIELHLDPLIVWKWTFCSMNRGFSTSMLGERECTCQPYLHEDELQRFLEMGSFQSFKASMELLVEGDKKWVECRNLVARCTDFAEFSA